MENEAKRILQIHPEVLKRMTRSECGEAAVVLIQFAFHLQRASNRQQSRIRWAEETVKKIIAPTLGQQKGYSYEERRIQAVRQDEAAQKTDDIRVKAQLRMERINYLSTKAEAMSKALTALQHSKQN